jgi:SEC-C motif-containing protein
VTFSAYFKEDENLEVMKEHSFFIQEEGNWKYDRGEMLEARIQRNEVCPCDSGKKYKKCCGK